MAELALITGGDANAFEMLLQQLMGQDNAQRAAAERLLDDLKKNPDACALQLVRSLRQSPNLPARSLAAVLLRKSLTRDAQSLWPGMSDGAKATVKSEMLNCIKEEQDRTTVRKVCDCVGELGAALVEDNKWPELLPFMFNCVQSGQERLLESALYIFEYLARYVVDVLVQYLGTIHGMLQATLNHNNVEVRLAAFRATVAFIQSLENPVDRDGFQTLVPAMLQVIAAALNAGEEDLAQGALTMFIEVADENPRFLRKQLLEVVQAMLAIAEAEQLDEGTRRLSAEFLVTLCEAREKAPGMMRKVPQFVERLFKCCISFLFDIEDDPAWHTAEDEKHEEEGNGDLFDVGQEYLDRLAIALGGKTLVPVVGAMLPILMADQDWKKRHAALICLAQIAEGCAKVMAEQTGPLVAICLQGCGDPHPKVRWASCQALGQLCTDLAPELQEEQHDKILPALMLLMDDFQNPRVQAHACAATVNFAEVPDQDLVAPYLDTLISKLLALLQNGRRNVQESALTALASVADCAKDYFIKYYDTCMPLLRHILEHARDKTHFMLRAKALECISLVGIAVGKDRFKDDVHQVMQYMQAVQAAGLDPDDPLSSYMMQAGARFCTTLQEDFLVYLPVVMPALLAAAQLNADIIVKSTDDSEDEDENDADLETFIVGDKRISLHTSILEEKANACSMLCCYAYELREGFFPYVNDVTQIMVPLLKFVFNEEVRTASAQTLPELLRSAVLASKKGMGPDEAFIANMISFIWPEMVKALADEDDPDVLAAMLTSTEEIIEVVEGPARLPVDQLALAFHSFATVLEEYEGRRKDRMERMNSEDFDAEENEALEEEHEAESELIDTLGNCCSMILRLYNDSCMPLIEGLMPAMGKLLEKGRYVEERRIALCLMDDVIQYSPVGAAKYGAQVLPLLLQGCADKDAMIRQCSVYGVGQAAEHLGDVFRPHAPTAAQAILAIINAPDARSADNLVATENAVSALGKLLEFQPDVVDRAAGTLFVNSLPITEDTTEAKVVHAQLLRFVQKSDARILGENNVNNLPSNLPKLVEIMVQVLGKGQALVDAETAKNMGVLLQQMQTMLPPGTFEQFVMQLKQKQQETLQNILNGQLTLSSP